MHLVRATQEPGVVREVDDAELLDLARSGILHSYKHTPEAKAVLEGTVHEPVDKWTPVKKTDDIVKAPPATTDPAAPATGDTDQKGE